MLTSFSYPKATDSYNINEEVSIVPYCDGDYCHYNADKNLPEGLKLDENTGIISGIVTNFVTCTNLTISCTDPNDNKLFHTMDLFFGIRYIIICFIGIITHFCYSPSHLQLKINEEVYLKPIYDGNNVHFSKSEGIYY